MRFPRSVASSRLASVLLVTVLAGGLALFAGWIATGGSAAASAATKSAKGRASASTPVKGGTLSWSYIEKPVSLDPNVWTGADDSGVMRLIFDPLIWSPKPGKYIPGLAKSWSLSKNGKVYTFNLRHDVWFQDGTKFTANAVKFMFDRIVNPKTKSLQIGAVGPYAYTQVINPYRVAIHFKRPWGAFLSTLSSIALSPVSPTAVKKYGDANFAQHPVGTGPFMFDKWVGNDLYLKRYPRYDWAPSMMNHNGPAYLSEVVVKSVPEASTRMDALQSGAVQMTHHPVLSELKSFQQQGFAVHEVDTPGFAWDFPIDVTTPPTNDLRVRQAILYGIDRQAIVRSVLFNEAKPAYGPLTAATLDYDPAVKKFYPYDPAKAAKLLNAAGWKMTSSGVRMKDGKPLSIIMDMFDEDTNKPISELTQAMLGKLGFKVTLNVTNYDAFASAITANKYNLAEMNWVALDPDQTLPTMFNSGNITGGGEFNRTRIANKSLDSMLAQAGESSNPQVRKRLYYKIQIMAMKNAWVAPIYDDEYVFVTSKQVHGMKFDLEGRPLLYNVSLSH